jgi:hypothetical protein
MIVIQLADVYRYKEFSGNNWLEKTSPGFAGRKINSSYIVCNI